MVEDGRMWWNMLWGHRSFLTNQKPFWLFFMQLYTVICPSLYNFVPLDLRYISYDIMHDQSMMQFFQWNSIQWLTKLSQCLVLLDYSLNSFECKTYINTVLVHQRKNLIRATQPSRNYVISIRGDEDMGNSSQGPIDSVLWDGIRTIRIWCSIYYKTCNPW